MIGPTHIAIAVTCGVLTGAGKPDLALLAGGAILPDLDHPKSFIGRVFFPISVPLHAWVGHRGAFHSFWLWGLVAVLGGLFWHPLSVIGIGGVIHVICDCSTVAGVRALEPWSSKLFVMFKREWRLKTGSQAEIVVLVIFGFIAWGGGYVGATGGIMAMMGHLTGAPKIMMEAHRIRGLQKCYVEDKLRWNSGEIEEGRWLIVGTEGQGIAMQGEKKLIHIPKSGQFLRARLKPTEAHWKLIKVKGWATAETDMYFFDGSRWHQAEPGDTVFGQVLGDEIVLESLP
jgi:inner membrane protein